MCLVAACSFLPSREAINDSESLDTAGNCSHQDSVDKLANCHLSLTLTALPTNRTNYKTVTETSVATPILSTTVQGKKSTIAVEQSTPNVNLPTRQTIVKPKPTVLAYPTKQPSAKRTVIEATLSSPQASIDSPENTPIAPFPISPLPTAEPNR